MKLSRRIISIVLSVCLCFSTLEVLAASTTGVGVTISMDNVRELPEGRNLLSGQLPLYVDYTPPNKGHFERTVLPTSTNMTDGNVSTDWLESKMVFADYNNGAPVIYSDGEAKCRITFFLKKVANINKICLINHKDSALMTSKYEIYAAKDLRSLYWPSSRVAYVENLEAMDRQIFDCNIEDAMFVGIKILCPVRPNSNEGVLQLTPTVNNHYPRICEFAIYGTEGELTEYPVLKNTSSKTMVSDTTPLDVDINLTNSFFFGKTPKVYQYAKPTLLDTKSEKEISSSNPGNLTDGVIDLSSYDEAGNRIEDFRASSVKFADKDENGVLVLTGSDTNYVDIRFDAGSQKELGLFYIMNHTTAALRTMHYKLYASNSSSKPTESNLIAECYNHGGAQEHYLVVSKGETVKARYYTLRVLDPCFDYSASAFDENMNNAYVRLLEIAAFTPELVSADMSFSKLQKVDTSNYGYLAPGTKVKTVMNAFSGRGVLRVEDSGGIIKAPGQRLAPDDKLIADTGFGNEVTAGIKFKGDMDGNGYFSLTDLIKVSGAILDGTANLNTADVNNSGKVDVTDVVSLKEIIIGKSQGIEDTSPSPAYGIKYGVNSKKYAVTVDAETVIKENFRSFGGNSFTSILMEEGMKAYGGYNRVYHELTRERLTAMKPKISRIWFQADWIVTDTLGKDGYKKYENDPLSNPDYINYKNGIYDFNSPQMLAFYEYVEMLNEIDCTIEINFGWKTATRIKDWFNAPCKDYMTGAPQDLPAFGKAAAALVKHLNEVKKYDFVEAITFYNEPNIGDFEIDTIDDRIHWSQLVHEVDKALKANGMRNKIEIWGPEVSGMENDSTKEWFRYQLDNTAACVDQWTGHNYYRQDGVKNNYSTSFDTFRYYAEKTGGNMLITEMYGSVINDIYREWYNWNDSFSGYYIAVSNAGLNGLLAWSLVGGYLPDPLKWALDTNTSAAWRVPKNEAEISGVQRIFYEETLFTNYIPDGSSVLYTDWIGRDIKAAAYRLPDGNITLVVENNGVNDNAVLSRGTGKEKDITITLSDGAERTFKRISYVSDTQVIDANATVNRPDKTISTVNGSFTDTLGAKYSVHLYTTAPIVKQIAMKNVVLHTKPGKGVIVKGEMLDCDEDDEIVYSISEFTGTDPGTVFAKNGVYVAPSNARSGDMVAVRASLKSDPSVFGVSVIYID